MAHIGASGNFDLDDDGILRDSMNGMDDLMIDEDGIVRDDDLDMYKHIARGHWTDSGIGGDKQSSTSTLQHLQNSFEDLAPIGDESINISEFEASKDELSEDDFGGTGRLRGKVADSLDLDKPGDLQNSSRPGRKNQRTNSENDEEFDKLAADFDNQQLFTPEYYQQLRDLGVLVDGADLSRDSLNEFEELESRVTSRAEGQLNDSDAENGARDDDQRDLIGEYLKHEYIKEQMENAESEREAEEARKREEQASKRKRARADSGVNEMEGAEDERFSRPSSGRTVSSRSFPNDVDDDDDYHRDNHSQHLGSQDGSQSQRMMGEDDEIFYINSHDGSSQGRNVQQQHHHQQRRAPGHSRGGNHGASPGLGSEAHLSIEDDSRSFYSDSHRSRPSSVTSHVSTASENVSARQKRAELVVTQQMSKAKSQESFFEGEQTPKSGEKTHHKRLLPQPSSSESNQSFRLKSKSVTNIAAKTGPVKPTHMSLSEITRLNHLEDSISGAGKLEDSTVNTGDESSGELTSRFTQEAKKRKQATELVQQLQKDYNSLLTKYALAELTIDQMRLGAKITVHADSPTPGQAQTGVASPAIGQAPQVMQLRSSPSQAVLRASPGQAMLGHMSPLVGVDSGDQTDARLPGDPKLSSRSDYSQSSSGSHRPSIADSEDVAKDDANSKPNKVKADLATQAHFLDERLESFNAMMEQRQLNLEQQEQAFEEIRSAHDVLRRSYLQAKDDYNVLRRSGALTGDEQYFDSNKELEGQLFRLGMRFDEVQEKVEGNLKEQSQRRQPFQADGTKSEGKHGDHTDKDLSYDDRGSARSDKSDHRRALNASRTNSIDSNHDPRLDQRIQEMRDDYNDNMDSYRKLKYTTDTPEGQKAVDKIVRRLHGICTEMPDMFRLSPEIQDRWDDLKTTDDKLKLVDRKSSVWEKLNQREKDKRSQRQSPVPNSGRSWNQDRQSPNLSRQLSDSSDIDSLRARLDGSRSSLGSILPDRMDRPPSRSDRPSSRSGNHRDRPSSRNSNRGHDPRDPDRPPSRSGARGMDPLLPDRSSQDRDSPNPSLPRPRRHEQRGVRDPKLSAMPDMGSMHSLPDSGISDQENRDSSRRRRHSHDHDRRSPSASGGAGQSSDGALAALPSSKFKQMTKQRAADDADSGFIGSVVGSGVGLPITRQQQQQQQRQQQQHEETLRLRRNVTDESSTITDMSMDTSGQQVEKPRSSRRKEGRGERSRSQRSQTTGHSSVENSYDGGEDTMETLESDMSMQRESARLKDRRSGARPKTKRKEENRDLSLDATLEEDITEESDISTPRAVNQKPSKSREYAPSSPKKSSVGTSPTPTKRPSSRQQTTSEEEEELKKAIAKERARQLKSQNLQTKDKNDSTHQKRLKSPPPPVRPSSRGSPTTDLYHTRERRHSGSSMRSRRSVQEEITRQEHTENLQPRAELRLEQAGSQIERPSSRQGRRPKSSHENHLLLPDEDDRNSEIARRVKEYEERSVGSDVEVGSSVTRASSTNSNRLRALQEEIERLKEGVAKANEKSSQPPPPQPPIYQVPPQQPPQQNQRDNPEFYDPFDDPYGFMRMPRRRANSFSGGREREWDEWYWTLPQNREYDGADIPLGYAAADAYADLPPSAAAGAEHERNSRENVRNRLRQRRIERRNRAETGPNAQPGVDIDPAVADVAPVPGDPSSPMVVMGGGSTPTLQRAGLSDDQTAAMYNYYVPSRFSTQGMRNQMSSRGFFTTPNGAKIYSNTGDDGRHEEEEEEEELRRRVIIDGTGQQQGSRTTGNSPWYQIRRTTRPFGSGPQSTYVNIPGGRRAQSHEDVSFRAQSQPNLYGTQPQQPSQSYGTYVSACPMCGGSSYHTHTNYVHTGQPATAAAAPQYYGSQDLRSVSPTRHGRPRSRSASHSRHYSPERSRTRSKSRTRYHIREYSRDLSDSDEESSRRRRRSRSESRGRTSYRSPPRSQHRSRKGRRRGESSYSDASEELDEGLDRSLSLSMDISRLTKKMIGALSTELKRSKDKREFGSSYW